MFSGASGLSFIRARCAAVALAGNKSPVRSPCKPDSAIRASVSFFGHSPRLKNSRSEILHPDFQKQCFRLAPENAKPRKKISPHALTRGENDGRFIAKTKTRRDVIRARQTGGAGASSRSKKSIKILATSAA
jgi:hypothetical protein